MISNVGGFGSRGSIFAHKLKPLSLLRQFGTDKLNPSVSDARIETDCRRIVDRRIILNDEENKLFTLLRNVGDMGEQKTVVRVAGGWVRDRLLGLSGKRDIDIVLDNLTGIKFAYKLNAYCRQKKLRTYSIGYIQPNPEKSKHLETTTCKIGNYSVDFVNLRTETYANVETRGDLVKIKNDISDSKNSKSKSGLKPSRIPSVEFGTPQEDALRRDLTINALFYNLHTDQLEDFTGNGLSDLDSGLVRTPFEALTTFKDDPLRILRLIRFACRYNLTIVDEVIKVLGLTCKSTDTSSGTSLNMIPVLNAKIARERISDELDKMLSFDGYYDSKDSYSSRERAISLLHSFNLLKKAIFVIPREAIHVPSTKALHQLLDATAVSAKSKRKTSSSNPLVDSKLEDASFKVLNAENCVEFDTFVDYGVSVMFLLRTLETYIQSTSTNELNRCNAFASLNDEESKYLRYAALAWWARDKYVLIHNGSGHSNNGLKTMSMAEYIFVVRLRIMCGCPLF